MSTHIDHCRPLPDTVIARCAGTDPVTYQAHGAEAAGDNRDETEENVGDWS